MLLLITINQIDFQIKSKLPKKLVHDKEIIEASKGTIVCTLTIEMVSKVLSELKNLKHQGLLLGASSQQ
jgi:hypothetical protein